MHLRPGTVIESLKFRLAFPVISRIPIVRRQMRGLRLVPAKDSNRKWAISALDSARVLARFKSFGRIKLIR